MIIGGGEKVWRKAKALAKPGLLIPVVAGVLCGISVPGCWRTADEPRYRGRLVSDWLRNEKIVGAQHLGIRELLQLKQVITGEEPEIVTFELPIKYDVLTNIGDLVLFVDGEYVTGQEIMRAQNGNCLVAWNTTFVPPGDRKLHVRLYVMKGLSIKNEIKIDGPELVFSSSNILRFDPFYSEYSPVGGGAVLHAKLDCQNATYRLEIRSETGERLKVIAGSTTNGVIEEHWDLVDEAGRFYTNESFRCVFYVELADGRSGRYVRLLRKLQFP